jgi:cardiolipin synthase
VIIVLLPNILSISRACCAPIFVHFIMKADCILALFIIILAALSDYFDGFIARKFNVESRLGSLLDPIADKIFCNSVIWSIYLYHNNSMFILISAIILSLRDLTLLLGGWFYFYSKRKSSDLTPIFVSKVCTTMLFGFSCISLLIELDSIWIKFIGLACSTCVIATFYLYIKRFLK